MMLQVFVIACCILRRIHLKLDCKPPPSNRWQLDSKTEKVISLIPRYLDSLSRYLDK